MFEILKTMTLSAGYGPLIYVGIFAATISSALGSYVCAPRIFQVSHLSVNTPLLFQWTFPV